MRLLNSIIQAQRLRTHPLPRGTDPWLSDFEASPAAFEIGKMRVGGPPSPGFSTHTLNTGSTPLVLTEALCLLKTWELQLTQIRSIRQSHVEIPIEFLFATFEMMATGFNRIEVFHARRYFIQRFRFT